MEIATSDLTWYWLKGNEISGRLLQDICLFRSHVLYDLGFRKNFGQQGKNYGDVQFSDFESFHIIACVEDEILGTVRVTPPHVETVALGVLGAEEYRDLIQHLQTTPDHIIEINRLMIDNRVRRLNLGRTLMYASIGLIENIWNRQEMTIIGSAGNCTKQAKFFLDHTDYHKIPNVSDRYASQFNDHITFLKYAQAPYLKGSDKIQFFTELFKTHSPFPYFRLKTGYQKNSKPLEL